MALCSVILISFSAMNDPFANLVRWCASQGYDMGKVAPGFAAGQERGIFALEDIEAGVDGIGADLSLVNQRTASVPVYTVLT